MIAERAVRDERTHWRDEELSARHRKWGWNCPAVDIDFLMIEYNHGKAAAIVEYMRYSAKEPNLNDTSYRAIADMANKAGLPFLVAMYWPDNWSFRVIPGNELAKTQFKQDEILSEYEFVRRLYIICYRELEGILRNNLNHSKGGIA